MEVGWTDANSSSTCPNPSKLSRIDFSAYGGLTETKSCCHLSDVEQPPLDLAQQCPT
jgi:hypothetical protein